jgi:nicotinamidase-related amidase/MFS family permease
VKQGAATGPVAQTEATDPADRRSEAFSWRFVTPLFMSCSLNPVNSSLIATALVPIAHAMSVSVGQTAVLVSALYLASSIAQPTAGKLAEELGPRRVFIAGIVLVLIGGIVGGVGQDLATLTVARVLIGIGTSAGYPAAMVIIRRRATWAGMSEPPGGVLGGIAIAGTVTIAVGPPIGGVLVAAFSWRAAFLINIPITVIALLLTTAWVPKDPPFERRPLREIASRIDVTGIALFGGTMTALLVFLLSLPAPDWIPLGIAVILSAVLVAWELRAATPFLDVRLLVSNLALTRTYLRGALTLLAFYTVLYGITQWLEAAHGLSPQQAGLALLPMGIVAAIVSRPLSSRNLVRGPLIVGAAALVAASVLVTLLTSSTPVPAIIAVTLLFAVTLGTTTVGNQTALYAQAPAEQVGTAAGLFRTFSYVGSIASSTITGIVFRHDVTDSGLHLIAAILAGTSIVVLALTVLDRTLRTSKATPPHDDEAQPQTGRQGDAGQRPLRPIDPRRTALVVIDMQPSKLDAVPGGGEVVEHALDAIGEARRHGLFVTYARLGFDDGDIAALPAAGDRALAVAAGTSRWRSDAAGTALCEALQPEPGEPVIVKAHSSAFTQTSLDERLRERGIDTVVLAGMTTSGAVLSTVRDAADLDYRVILLADAVADPDADLHRVLAARLMPRFADVIQAGDLQGLLRAGPVPSE